MRAVRVGAATLVASGLLLAGCGDDGRSDTDEAAAEPETRPEDVRVSDAEAADGIAQIDELVDEVAEAVTGDEEGAAGLNDEIHPVWESVEGTVQANDADAYIAFEDNFALLTGAVEEGDAAGAEAAAEAVSETARAYLAAYPG